MRVEGRQNKAPYFTCQVIGFPTHLNSSLCANSKSGKRMKTAMQVNPWDYLRREDIDKLLDLMPRELQMEKLRRYYFGGV